MHFYKVCIICSKIATVLVQSGTLKTNTYLVAGTSYAKVRSLSNELGKSVPMATPSTAVEVYGWKSQPQAGELVTQVESKVRIPQKVILKILYYE